MKAEKVVSRIQGYPWRVEARGLNWYVVWIGPGRKRPKRVGSIRSRGRDHHKMALAEAERRNRMYR